MEYSVLISFLLLFTVVIGEETLKVLVTGGAGFIGFHTASKLVDERNADVTVLDNFNHYYDVNLKKARADVLKKKGVKVHKGDLCNERLVRYLFETVKFDAVIHMAAQAGVAYSVVDPISYVTANIECLVNMLDILADYKDVHLVYSSSSSVYGHNPIVPFSPKNPLVAPSNMYAALKMAGEEMVAAYCEKYKLSVVGVRPFTVYGPWGRPDMAVYGMTKEMNDDQEIEVRQCNKSTIVQRDFTYVDDLVDGVLKAMDYKPKRCDEVYNLGRGRPISVSTLVSLLEQNLGKTAKVKYVPLPNYELPITHADISMTTEVLGYEPQIHVEEGVKRFVDWFKEYHIQKKWSSPEPDNSLEAHMEKTKLDYLNEQYHERIAKLRLKYQDYAEKNNKVVAKFYKDRKFIEHKGYDSSGRTVRNVRGKSVDELKKICGIIDECVAFNTKGDLKVFIDKESKWVKSSSTLYVADIDVCQAGLHNCFGNSTCKSLGPGQFECGCNEGWGLIDSHTCVELYKPGKKTKAEEEHITADKIDAVDWEALKKDKSYARIEHKKTSGGDIAYFPDARNDIDRLKKACDDTYHCLGFSTFGTLKGMVRPESQWSSDSNDLYLLDVNYCNMNPIGCSRGKSCKREKAGIYKCM